MTVADYVREFVRLGKYAHHIIPTNADRVERFRAGLVMPIYNAMLATNFPTLTKLINKAK